MTRSLIHPRDELLQTIERIYRYRMTTTSGGNLSIRDTNGDIWVTPARVDKGSLRRNDMVCVHGDGSCDGIHPPSSELPFHQAIYEARPDVRAIVHAHPVALVAFSIVKQVPNTRLFHQARTVCGEVGFAPYALPGSASLGREIAAAFRNGCHCVILENHGVVVAGDSMAQAFQRFETLEFTAQTIIRASQLGTIHYLTDHQIELPKQRVLRYPPLPPHEPTSAEKELRRQICEFVRRGYQQRLLISTEGSFSARLDDESLLITPYQVDRNTVDVSDIVLVRNGRCEEGKTPSRATGNHSAIYARHPEIRAVVNAYTVSATAFSCTGAAFDTRTIPESYIFLRDIQRVKFGIQFRDNEALAQIVAPQHPIAILENDGVLVCGKSVLDAFDRLEVLESTADAILSSRPLGPLVAMSDDVIAELTRAFLTNEKSK